MIYLGIGMLVNAKCTLQVTSINEEKVMQLFENDGYIPFDQLIYQRGWNIHNIYIDLDNEYVVYWKVYIVYKYVLICTRM